jgi:integrase
VSGRENQLRNSKLDMSIKLKFTEKAIQNLPSPTDRARQIYSDTDQIGAKRREAVPGLQVAVFKSGTRSFVLCRKLHGKTRFITLGKYPDLSVEDARGEARDLIAGIRKGVDPLKNKRANSKKHITLVEVFTDYVAVRGNQLSENTVSNYRTVVNVHLKTWKSKEMRAISRAMVQRKHAEVTERSPSSANKTMRVLRALFNFAHGQYENEDGKGLFPDNPVSRLSHVRVWNRETRRQNWINNSDMKPWFKAVLDIDSSDPYAITVKDYLITILLTGMRRREVAPLMWADINFMDRTLIVGKTKNGDPLLLPLSDYLHELLSMRRLTVTSLYVFPGGQGNKYISEPKKHIVRIRESSGVHFTLHDLRRTFITMAEALDIPAYALKKLVNHRAKEDVTAGYVISGVERLRKPTQLITNYILSVADVRKASEVVNINDGQQESTIG